ncbi:hypothetical protein O181_044493 [Austropuccinia psidii MF-1]|uniref:Uncharacterized protein n=1 Tax=Austropuccinia psidii MF-1 TaxID=1389203 RepID=A0A9Q3DQ67_9BASI|nr:hypothetical protein [Austropuccinia psidii MF-1]
MSQRDILQRPCGNHQRMESHQEVETPGGEGNQDKGESSHYPSYRRASEQDRDYCNFFRLTRIRPTQLSSGFKPLRNKQINVRGHNSSQSQVVSRRRKGYKGKKRHLSAFG